MAENPYQSPDNTSPHRVGATHRILFWFSPAIVVLGFILWLAVVGSVAVDIVNGYGSDPQLAATVAILFTIGLGMICIPQFFSVFRRSLRFAKLVTWISIAGIVIGLAAAVVYPIVEFNYDFSPPGFEVLGAISYSIVAGLFAVNFWLHRSWKSTLIQNRAPSTHDAG